MMAKTWNWNIITVPPIFKAEISSQKNLKNVFWNDFSFGMFHCWAWINQFGVWEVFELFISTIASFYLAPFPRIMTSIPHFLYGRLSVFQDTVNPVHSTLNQAKLCGYTRTFSTDYFNDQLVVLALFEIVLPFHPTLICDHLKVRLLVS